MNEEKTLKKNRLNLSMTDELFETISQNAEEQDMSLSAYCIHAIEMSLGKVQRIDPRTVTIEPIDIYTDDIREGLNKIGNTAAKIDRLLFTLSQKESAADYEMKRLSELTNQLREEEKEFNDILLRAYNERVDVRKTVIKHIEKTVKKAFDLDAPKGKKEPKKILKSNSTKSGEEQEE